MRVLMWFGNRRNWAKHQIVEVNNITRSINASIEKNRKVLILRLERNKSISLLVPFVYWCACVITFSIMTRSAELLWCRYIGRYLNHYQWMLTYSQYDHIPFYAVLSCLLGHVITPNTPITSFPWMKEKKEINHLNFVNKFNLSCVWKKKKNQNVPVFAPNILILPNLHPLLMKWHKLSLIPTCAHPTPVNTPHFCHIRGVTENIRLELHLSEITSCKYEANHCQPVDPLH